MEILFYIFLWWLSGFITVAAGVFLTEKEVKVSVKNLIKSIILSVFGPLLLVLVTLYYLDEGTDKILFTFKGWKNDD